MRIANYDYARLRDLPGFEIRLYGMPGLTRATSPASTATPNEKAGYFKVR